ncbi:UNVERIFIED_CONTAM: hypothetical protein K2H54_041527 [Gekko kuhli]
MENQGAGGGEEELGKMNPKRGGSGRVPEEESKNKPKLPTEMNQWHLKMLQRMNLIVVASFALGLLL